MKMAEIGDIWRKLDRDAPRLRLVNHRFRNLPGVSDDTVSFESSLTAICGPNGAGKSALLRSIWLALNWEDASKRSDSLARVGNITAIAQVSFAGVNYNATIEGEVPKCQSDLPATASISHIEPARDVFEYLSRLFSKGNPKAFLDTNETLELEENEIKLLSYVCGKSYSKISITEIEEIEPVVPYFKVIEHDVPYDSTTMSMGELAILLIYWTIRRASTGSLFLLEEPESFISPIGQSALINMLAKLCVEKKSTMIFTTHSPQLIAPLSEKQKRFLMRASAMATLMSPDAQDQSEFAMGLSPPRSFILASEDRAAKEFARILIATLSPKTLKKVYLSSWEGATKISNVLRIFARDLKDLNVIGLFDGDQRAKIGAEPPPGKYVFLPGDIAIEEQFRNLTRNKISEIAQGLRMTTQALTAILSGLAGQNHHDWFENFVHSKGFTYDHIMSAFVQVWLDEGENGKQAQTFVTELNREIDAIEESRRRA